MTGNAPIDVSILIVSFNTREMTLEAISSAVRETTVARYEIIVADNASDDGSADAIAAHPARPHLIRLDRNIGFGRANNLAAEVAKGDYILLLNPDTVVLDGAIDRLVAFAKANRRALIWGGRTLFADGRLNPASCRRRLTMWNLFCRAVGLNRLFPLSDVFNGETYASWPRDCVREVDIVSGCFLLVPRPIWLALGGFDDAFFVYGGDADLCLRAKRIGARPLLTPEAVIIHHGGASDTVATAKLVSFLRAQATLISRHFGEPFDIAGRFLLMMWPFSRWLASALKSTLTGDVSARERAQMWRDVWEQRTTWRFGSARPEPAPASRTAENRSLYEQLAGRAGSGP